jgi:hypothetical protein
MSCTCTEPGYCPRHHCRKSPHFWKLCQTRPDYFELWEQGHGPGQGLNLTPATQAAPRSDDEVAAILVICLACEQFNGSHCKAAAGGCQSSRMQCWQRWLREKQCPIGKWDYEGT